MFFNPQDASHIMIRSGSLSSIEKLPDKAWGVSRWISWNNQSILEEELRHISAGMVKGDRALATTYRSTAHRGYYWSMALAEAEVAAAGARRSRPRLHYPDFLRRGSES